MLPNLTPDMDLAAELFAGLRAGSADGEGVTREAYGPGERMAHALVRAAADRIGLESTVDVAGNLFMGREPMKSVLGIPFLDEAKMHADAREMLKGLGISIPDTRLLVRNLSGGQRQAMALLMSTMTPIEFLILDEHTAALDPKTAEIIMELTGRIVREKQLTTIMVTHNLRYAVEYGDRLLMMHQGRAEMDVSGEARKNLKVEDILEKFNAISIECGN